MAEPTIQVRGPAWRLGDFQAVAGVDFDVRPGARFGLLGPNGAGQTALTSSSWPS